MAVTSLGYSHDWPADLFSLSQLCQNTEVVMVAVRGQGGSCGSAPALVRADPIPVKAQNISQEGKWLVQRDGSLESLMALTSSNITTRRGSSSGLTLRALVLGVPASGPRGALQEACAPLHCVENWLRAPLLACSA